MPRKAFIADLNKAIEGVSIAGISKVLMGGDDGEFTFLCDSSSRNSLRISALIPDLSEYPSSHTYMLFAPDDAPASIASTLSDISDSATGKTVVQLLELVSRSLESSDQDGDSQMLDSQQLSDTDMEDDEEDDYVEDLFFPGDEIAPTLALGKHNIASTPEGFVKPTSAFRHRIRSDLLTVKAHGFKVGHLGGLMDGMGSYVSLSIRISKLGISEEAMRAWQVESSEYLVVILFYPNGYKSMDSMKAYDLPTARQNFEIRVGVSTTYKPTTQEAIRAFTVLSKEEEKRREADSQIEAQAGPQKGYRNSFISRPLNELLRERFPALVHYRYAGMPWNGAEAFYNDHYGTQLGHSGLAIGDRYLEPEQISAAYPPIVTADHIQESGSQDHSLPLVAMQFVLRHFVRCTEFCLICFTKMPDDLQAIKPYVCEKPLCLYQYMSLGFGPSIEHEILSQPKVVDLLVSFCYATARLGSLKDFPTGLSLTIPPKDAWDTETTNELTQAYYGHNRAPAAVGQAVNKPLEPQKARYNAATRELIFDNPEPKCPLRVGDWIVFYAKEDSTDPQHCRIAETAFYPTVKVAEPVQPAGMDSQAALNRYSTSTTAHSTIAPSSSSNVVKPATPPPPPPNEFRDASFFVYNQNFDELDDHDKRQAIYSLLDILPSVEEMKQYLTRKAQSSLSSWVDRLPPALGGILRWIIASNRACIVQVEDDNGWRPPSKMSEERLYGMAGWTQFRFAMGAPDKERRFIKAVRDTSNRLNLKYPTIFAWHGSPLQNWHSIIREGLHFNHTTNGRAYGHGVYHSLDVNTSIGYCGYGAPAMWPMSDLRVSSSLALNEIVNAPKEYVSSSPHLVVAQLDWIQTRYLFIRSNSVNYTSTNTGTSREVKPAQYIEQDPNMTPRGASDKIVIPQHAISSRHRNKMRSQHSSNKRRKGAGATILDPIYIDGDEDDDTASIATMEEDLVILQDEDVQIAQPDFDPLPTPNSIKGKSKAGSFLSKLVGSKSSLFKPLTDFEPGTLDFSSLPLLQEPEYATVGATRRLMKDFQDLIKVQSKEPAHELGWFIDPNRPSDNMYQWIVELHSFDPTLPLAKDMKTRGLKSIVMELRFGKEYPMSPPFVRVIRPRFLGFQQGGGGHVTAGGALCMELLTNNGWSAVSSIESVLLQVRMAISSLEPKPARLDSSSKGLDYGVGEAVDAYIRACNAHGWQVPAGFKEMAYGGDPSGGFAQQY